MSDSDEWIYRHLLDGGRATVSDVAACLGTTVRRVRPSVAQLVGRRGIDVRSVHGPQSMDRPGRFTTVLGLAELDEKARLLPSLPLGPHIVYMRVAPVPLSGPDYDALAVIHPSGLLDALVDLYEAYWDHAQPITGAAPGKGAPSA